MRSSWRPSAWWRRRSGSALIVTIFTNHFLISKKISFCGLYSVEGLPFLVSADVSLAKQLFNHRMVIRVLMSLPSVVILFVYGHLICTGGVLLPMRQHHFAKARQRFMSFGWHPDGVLP